MPPEVLNVMTGEMRSVHDNIVHNEKQLLSMKHPSYPVYVVKVPRALGFVDTNPAEVFFIRYEDVFMVFHLGRLDPSVVRLVLLNMAHDIITEKTPNVAIMDPFYMDEGILETHGDRIIVTKYVTGFLLDNKDKKVILMPFFPQ